MKHPNEQELMAYLYGESSPAGRAGLTEHLSQCAECAARMTEWRATRTSLDGWQLESWASKPRALRSRIPRVQPALTWAAAAAIVLAAGFGLGRMASAASGVEQARAELRQEFAQLRSQQAELLHAELSKAATDTLVASGEQTRALLADYATALELKLGDDQDAIYSALNKLDTQRLADYVGLKKDLDTVAVLTDAGLRHTQQELIQLADATQPANISNRNFK
jgi:anti-sigma factor ChrR (cupin superfamily)